MAMTITFLPGKKGPNDKIILWNGIQVEMPDIAIITNQLCINEDNLFPRDRCHDCRYKQNSCEQHRSRLFDGGQMFINFLQEVYDAKGVTDELLRKYKLGQYRPKIS
jgi:hypothetical protein